MRDAFGSTFMFRIIIIFIVFYVSFITIAANYAKVFRIKNHVIDILEQYSCDIGDLKFYFSFRSAVDTYLDSFTYQVTSEKAKAICTDKGKDKPYIFTDNGVCVIQNTEFDNEKYYEVISYLVIKFPVFSFEFVVPVSGYSRVMNVS